MDGGMKSSEFVTTVQRLTRIAGELDAIDLDAFLERLGETETMAPVFAEAPGMDATGGLERLSAIREYAEAARRFKGSSARYRERMGALADPKTQKLLGAREGE